MKIGVSSYSYSQYLKSGKLTLISVIAKAAEMGFEAIEFTNLPEDTAENRKALAMQIKEEADRVGIDLSAYVCGGKLLCDTKELQQAEVERLKGELDIANILGVKLFRYDVLYKLPQHTSFDAVLDEVAPAMRQLAQYGESLGIMTMIENHGHTFQDYDRIEKTYYAVNHKNFGLLIDIGNFMCADEDNVMCVSRLAHLARHVHLKDFIKKDFYSTDSKEHHFRTRGANYLLGVAVGDGDAKTVQCLTILQNAGYDGYIDIEFEGPADCITEIAKGLTFYKTYINQ